MFGLCKYKDALGVAGKNDKQRILGIRSQDILLTLSSVLLFCFFTGNSLIKTLIFTLIITFIVHRMFCVRTVSDTFLFPDENDYLRFYIFTLIGLVLIYYFQLFPKFRIAPKFGIVL
jgi:hypothetical protein